MSQKKKEDILVKCSLCGKEVLAGNFSGTQPGLRYPVVHGNEKSGSRCNGSNIAVNILPSKKNKKSAEKHQQWKDVYDAIVCYKMENDGNSPSVRWLQEKSGVKSLATIHQILGYLEEDGKIRMSDGEVKSRSIVIVGGEWLPPEEWLDEEEEEEEEEEE